MTRRASRRSEERFMRDRAYSANPISRQIPVANAPVTRYSNGPLGSGIAFMKTTASPVYSTIIPGTSTAGRVSIFPEYQERRTSRPHAKIRSKKTDLRSALMHRIVTAVVLALLLSGCSSGPPRAPSIGEAFVGPMTLKLRADIPVESATVATVKHGDRLEILQRRRKFLRVRAPGGAEGWTDERQLLAAADMASLRELSERAAKMPSQGVGAAFGDLRVHTQASLQAPSFLVIKENEKFDVLADVVVPRTDLARTPLIPPAPKKAKAPRKPGKEPRIPPVPMPKPPGPPPDWLALSKTELPLDETAEPDEEPAKPVPTDHWSLIRTPGGQSGWVRTRTVRMAIPDEVAQYAEGHRIVSYFPLGEVADGDQKKKIWLWTTIHGGAPYDFDSFRVFVWSLRHHRYETAYIERNVEGYSPVLLREVDFSSGAKGKNAAAKYPGFSVCVVGKDGQRHRREYALLGTTVRYAGDRACEPPPSATAANAPAPLPGANPGAPPPAHPESLFGRLKKRVKGLLGR